MKLSTLFDPYGRTLSEDVRKGAKDVLESLEAFANAFTDIVSRGDGSEEDYLVKTGEVHDTISAVRQNLPEDNVSAVRKRWSTDRGMLEDSLADVQSMIEDDEDEDPDEDEDDGFDDELDMLGLGPTKKMSPEELDRTKKVHSLLRMVVLLHKRIFLDILKHSSPSISDSTFDKLPPLSHKLLLAMEDVVAALYAPQDVPTVHSSIAAIADSVYHLQPLILNEFIGSDGAEAVDALTKKMEQVSVSGKLTKGKDADVRKWFNTCFEQIAKLSQTIVISLNAESMSSS
ncbi:hypothetical protein BDY19DRAFT_902285 [Irpex rosettiformis]|uniref:Uncharacterized protein n=1 Tax=Irpex rosettiformis TaxID=378272 RepID=A0ACB8UGT6_9APHY|nr:hypothetical protein BDY19DRAFT_902285 [Irpex rosettiformis]